MPAFAGMTWIFLDEKVIALESQRADPVIFGIADIKRAVMDADAMRARQGAGARVADNLPEMNGVRVNSFVPTLDSNESTLTPFIP